MKLQSLAGKRILILGYAREGQATERFLREHVPSATLLIADQKDGPNYLDAQKDADIIIKTPGIPPRLLYLPYTTGTDLFHAYIEEHGLKNTVIGVTGSKVKSTTASLITAILRAAGKTVHFIGNIGTPALDVLEQQIKPDDIFVMELSSYQCEDLDWSPHISVITSIFPEHLTYHGGFGPYLAAKSKIVARAASTDFFVFNPKYPDLVDLSRMTLASAMPFIEKLPFDVSDAKLKGEHNLDNIRAALTVARLLDVTDEIVANVVSTFEPLPHRMTDIGTFKGIRFVDDAIATAPEPTIFAIETLTNVDTILLGGEDRGYDFSSLAECIKNTGIRNIVLFPETGERIEEALEKAGVERLRIKKTGSMKAAVEFAYEKTRRGGTCLLSTASPSYSLWKNFEEKGDQFTSWVKTLGSPQPIV